MAFILRFLEPGLEDELHRCMFPLTMLLAKGNRMTLAHLGSLYVGLDECSRYNFKSVGLMAWSCT